MLRPVKFSRVVIALLMSGAGTAQAQRAEADAEFQRGRALMAEGRTAQACAAFEASMALEAQRGTLYNLAICHDKLGKIATAWAEFVELGRTDSNEARAQDSRQRAAALSPRLPRMHIVTHGSGVKVTRNGVDVTPLIGEQAPVDPGTYRFEARAEGREPYVASVDLTAEGTIVQVDIPVQRARATTSKSVAIPPPIPEPLPGEYPRDLPHRPILIPKDTVEVTAGPQILTSDDYDRFGVDAGASVRGRLGPLEASALVGFHLRSPYVMNKPNPWESVGIGLRYPIDPAFVVGGAYVEHQPLRSERRGSDVSAAVERKLLVYPNVAVHGQAGFMFSQRGDDDEFILMSSGQVQFGVVGPLSLAGVAGLRFNLGGQLYDYTTGLDVAALALWAITPQFDVFAQAGSFLLPDSAKQTYVFGANWRTR